MELGNLVWFSSHEHPFAVRERHCLDLDCACTDVWLTFTEVNLSGGALSPPLVFEIQMDLRTGCERRRSKRPAEIDALVREFLVRFPDAGLQQMIERRQEQRGAKLRLETYQAEPSQRGEVLAYSQVIYEDGGVKENGRHFGFFFTHEGQDYLIEDHYCVNPVCDCQTVHLEFWKRKQARGHARCVTIEQSLIAAFTLAGDFQRMDFSHENARAAEKIARAWCQRCDHHLPEMRRRYHQMKAIGRRSFPRDAVAAHRGTAAQETSPRVTVTTPAIDARAGRNDPCPCGSGQKFKRCCGRR